MCSWRASSTGWQRHPPEALGQIFHHHATLTRAHGGPGPDLLQGAATPAAQPGAGVIGADFHARAFHGPQAKRQAIKSPPILAAFARTGSMVSTIWSERSFQ